MTHMGKYIRLKRYAEFEEETWSEMSNRIASHVSRAELSVEKREAYKQLFFESMDKGYFLPGGRILANSGRVTSALLNCFLLQPNDSRESLARTFGEYFTILGTGGGCGLSYSNVRPRGTQINSGGESSGVLGWGDIHHEISKQIRVGGGRRGATMFSLDYRHPEILEFITSKNSVPNKEKIKAIIKKLDCEEDRELLKSYTENSRLTEMNISVEIDNDFLDRAEKGLNYSLVWQGKEYKQVSATEVWERMIRNAIESGDPGTMNLGRANFYSNSYYFWPLVGTNPCGEIPLPNYGCCCLGSLVLPNFVNSDSSFNWEKFKDHIHIGIRFLDNVLDTTVYPLPQIKQVSTDERRIGLGFMGLHHTLLLLGMKYSSPTAISFAEEVCRFMMEQSYLASCSIAEEKGSFPRYRRDLFLQSNFVKENVPESIQQEIFRKGMRNVACLMVAPTGTTSLIAKIGNSFGTTSGIEAMPAVAYKRRIREEDGFKDVDVVHASVISLYKAGKLDISLLESCEDISPETHFEIHSKCARYIDNSISKTIILPKDFSEQELSDLWLYYGKKVVGTTVYRTGTYQDQPITPIPVSETILEKAITEEIDKSCKNGMCS